MAMKLRNILIFFCCIVHGINTQNRIPGDAISRQKRIPEDVRERTSAKIDADDKSYDKKRTSDKVDADHPKTKTRVKDNLKKGGKYGTSTPKNAYPPKIKAHVKRENSPAKDPTYFAPVKRKSRKVKKDRRKGGIHTKPQSQYDTAPVNYPLYEDNFPIDSFRSYPIYGQSNLKPLAGGKPSMLGHKDTFQPGQQGRVAPFGGNFPKLSNYYDDTSLQGQGRLAPFEGGRSSQLGIPDRFNSQYSGRKGGSYPQLGKPGGSYSPLYERNSGLAPTEDGSYPQLVNPDRPNFPLSGKNGGLGPLEGGTYPQHGKPDNSNSPLFRRNGRLTPLQDENYPAVEGNAGLKSPIAYGRSYPQLGSQYDNYGRGLEDGDFPRVVGKDDRDYLPINGERYYSTNGLNTQVSGGGNYPLLGSQDGQFGNQILPGRQSGREGMPDELVKRNRLWK